VKSVFTIDLFARTARNSFGAFRWLDGWMEIPLCSDVLLSSLFLLLYGRGDLALACANRKFLLMRYLSDGLRGG
jgi:hypothetical protein